MGYELMNQMAKQLDGATPSPAPSPAPPTPTPAVDEYRCSDNQCVASSGGVSKEICGSMCGPQMYRQRLRVVERWFWCGRGHVQAHLQRLLERLSWSSPFLARFSSLEPPPCIVLLIRAINLTLSFSAT